jgi:hypothetical protein
MSAVMGTFVSIKTMADGSPRITLDMQCTLADVAAMGLIPGVPFALARLTKEASLTPPAPSQEPSKQPIGALCRLAVQLCEEPSFITWLRAVDSAHAKAIILNSCGISSRKELDTNEKAAQIFHSKFRQPFVTRMGTA